MSTAPLTLPTTSRALVVIPCGAAKATMRSPARLLYVSQYFRANLRYAEAVGQRVVILSAKHGLLDPRAWVHPYDQRMTPSRATDQLYLRTLRTQAEAVHLDTLPPGEVLVLGGALYLQAARTVWPHAVGMPDLLPAGMRGIGHQLQALQQGAAAAERQAA